MKKLDDVRTAETDVFVVISPHGRPVEGLASPEDVDRLERLRAAGPEKGLASVAGGWTGGERCSALDAASRPPVGFEPRGVSREARTDTERGAA